jgi:hypothetical protein
MGELKRIVDIANFSYRRPLKWQPVRKPEQESPIKLVESKRSIYLTLNESLTGKERHSILSQVARLAGISYAALTGKPDNNIRLILDDASFGDKVRSEAGNTQGVAKAEFVQVPTIAPPSL